MVLFTQVLKTRGLYPVLYLYLTQLMNISGKPQSCFMFRFTNSTYDPQTVQNCSLRLQL